MKEQISQGECLLSIVVPVYNVSEWLPVCMDSILGQTWENFELICVDDGSTDNSLQLLYEYSQLDSRVKVIHKENGGLVSARKVGAQCARGVYIGVVDSDDWVDRDLFEKLMKAALQRDADVVTSGHIKEYEKSTVVYKEKMSAGLYEGENIKKRFLPNIIGIDEFFSPRLTFTIWGKVYRADIYKKYQLLVPDEITMAEDAACLYPIFLNAKKICVLGGEGYHYRVRSSSMSNTCNRNLKTYRPAMDYLKKYFLSAGYQESREQFAQWNLYYMLLIAPKQVWQYIPDVPYDALPQGKLLLYGTGKFGKAIAEVLKQKKGIQIVGYIDKRVQDMEDGIPFYLLEDLKKESVEFDYILVSVLQAFIRKEIKEALLAAGIPQGKILYPHVQNAEKIMEKIEEEWGDII